MTDRSPLHELAGDLGVDIEYWSWRGEHVVVADDTLVAVLGALGVDATSAESCGDELRRRAASGGSRGLPHYVVLRQGDRGALPRRPNSSVELTLTLEDGTSRTVDALPDDLPSGYHRLTDGTDECLLIVPPRRVPLPERLNRGPAWGLAAQLYSVRSERSWGIGDLGDLATLVRWAAGEHAADFVLVNPLHAAEVVAPMQESPYLPTTRRFANPLYLRVEDVPEYATLDAATQTEIDSLAQDVRTQRGDLLDRDASWTAKRAALELLHGIGRTPERDAAYAAYLDREGGPLRDFARWCAISEIHGSSIDAWPDDLRDPAGDAVAALADERAGRVEFHSWLQWLLDEQLAVAQHAATSAGMGLGIVHDVAVGVAPDGADAWAWQRELATSVTVGAPPDAYSQTGQDWDQPPWRPDRLAELGYAPFRDLFASALRHSGGLRVDHVIGLFRLWWIPRGAGATAGTYVHYDHDALIGILMIEAARAGAVLVGEDLGNVEPWVREYLSERGVFGTSILWFENDYAHGGRPLPPEQWREYCLASVTTHDLPPTTGYLAQDHVRLRHELGLLTGSLDAELAEDRAGRHAWLDLLREHGLLAAGDDDPEHVVLALHRALSRAPSLLRCAALTDLVGDRRTQNQPGTKQAQYPNWRIPLGGPDGEPVLLDQIVTDQRVATVAEAMRLGTATAQ